MTQIARNKRRKEVARFAPTLRSLIRVIGVIRGQEFQPSFALQWQEGSSTPSAKRASFANDRIEDDDEGRERIVK